MQGSFEALPIGFRALGLQGFIVISFGFSFVGFRFPSTIPFASVLIIKELLGDLGLLRTDRCNACMSVCLSVRLRACLSVCRFPLLYVGMVVYRYIGI